MTSTPCDHGQSPSMPPQDTVPVLLAMQRAGQTYSSSEYINHITMNNGVSIYAPKKHNNLLFCLELVFNL